MLAGSDVITRVAFAMARSEEPWATRTGPSSFVEGPKIDPVEARLEESREVVRCGAAGVGVNVVCIGGEVGGTAAMAVPLLVSDDSMETIDDGTAVFVTRVLFFEEEVTGMDIPNVPKTVLAVLRRLSQFDAISDESWGDSLFISSVDRC
jgi:hypothetical protein